MGATIQQTATYRPEIDGLRAVAVASVVAYHIDKEWLPGGYVGVDVFFVISGFLITSIVWRELQLGSFSLADFYLRRVRRIIPVMLVVVLATLVAGAALLLPDALSRLSMSAMFAAASAANIYFWLYLDDDYFAEASDQEPLLHLWSLGVEEQFYLVWPVLLLLLSKMVRGRNGTIVLFAAVMLAACSFGLAEATNESRPKFSYFMLPARAGELMLGAVLAMAMARSRVLRWAQAPLTAEILGVAGLSAIVYSITLLDDRSPFPGINALYPCIGAALVILAGPHSRVLRVGLANQPMIWLGLLSYSVYLWHWPILAFIRYFYGTVSVEHAVVAMVAILGLSVLSYRYIERPARRLQWPGTKQFALLLVLPVAAVIAPAAYVWQEDGLKDGIESTEAYTEGLDVLDAETDAAYNFDYNCQLHQHDPEILSDPRCLIGAEHSVKGAPRVLLWGDSHAAHHVGAIDVLGEHGGVQIRNASHSSCPPVFGGDYSHGNYKKGCSQFRPYIREHVRAGEFDVVILAAGWAKYDDPEFRSDVIETVAEIRASGASVVLLGQAPVLDTYNRECDMRWLRLGGSNCRELEVENEKRPIESFLASLQTADGAVSFLDISEAICSPTSCPAYLDGKPLYFDKSHLSMSGSRRIGERIINRGQARTWLQAIDGKDQG